MGKRYFGKSPRQHLIEQAAMKLQSWHSESQPPNERDAVDAILSVVSHSESGSLGDHMKSYVYRTYGWQFYALAFEIEKRVQR